MNLIFLIVSLSFVTCEAIGNPEFSYFGQHGPNHWGENYNGCVGKHQSPINIEEHIVTNISLPLLTFSGLELARGTYLLNNGHTVMLKLNNSESATIAGGPLGKGEYVFEQLHFHWGENDDEGSEDLINNHSFAMELHAVFYKKSYDSMNMAVDHSDGLTVLAYFFEASDEDNPIYEPIVEALPSIESVGKSTKLMNLLVIEPFLNPEHLSIQNYYTYNGSLTTPPCSEVVTWIDFKDPLPLSHKQIAAFRNIRSTDGDKLTHNFRPIQPLEDREIFHNIPEIKDTIEDHSGSLATYSTLSLVLGSIFLTFLPEFINILWNTLE